MTSANLDDSKEKGVDLLILKAIKKMKRLDQILANKQSRERAVKKQGRELRAKLWEEFQVRNTRLIPEYFYEPSLIFMIMNGYVCLHLNCFLSYKNHLSITYVFDMC